MVSADAVSERVSSGDFSGQRSCHREHSCVACVELENGAPSASSILHSHLNKLTVNDRMASNEALHKETICDTKREKMKMKVQRKEDHVAST